MALIVETPDKVSAKCEYIGDIETLPKIKKRIETSQDFKTKVKSVGTNIEKKSKNYKLIK